MTGRQRRQAKHRASRTRRMLALLGPATCSRYPVLGACRQNTRANLKSLIPPDWHEQLMPCKHGVTYRPCMQCCRTILACKPWDPCCYSCTHRLTWDRIEIKINGLPFTGFTGFGYDA